MFHPRVERLHYLARLHIPAPDMSLRTAIEYTLAVCRECNTPNGLRSVFIFFGK
jgi:hypothetical protein